MCPHTHTWLQHVDWMFIPVLGCDALTTTVQFIPHCLNSLWVPQNSQKDNKFETRLKNVGVFGTGNHL